MDINQDQNSALDNQFIRKQNSQNHTRNPKVYYSLIAFQKETSFWIPTRIPFPSHTGTVSKQHAVKLYVGISQILPLKPHLLSPEKQHLYVKKKLTLT